MSNLRKKLAATVPFAHLLGIRAESEKEKDSQEDKEQEAKRAEWAKKAETDDDRKQRDDESDGEYVKRMEEMDEEEEKARRAERDEPDGDEGLEDESEDAKAARRAERARCAKIIAHGIKLGVPEQAGVFAFDTGMSAKAAISALTAGAGVGRAKRPGLADRMAGTQLPRVGADAPAPAAPGSAMEAAQTTAAAICKAAAKARGETV